MPRQVLVGAAESDDPPPVDPAGLIMAEFDIPVGELQSDAARGLMEAELLIEIDPSKDVVGISVSIDPQDERQVELLALAYRSGTTHLESQIRKLAGPLALRYQDHPLLEPLLHFALDDDVDQ